MCQNKSHLLFMETKKNIADQSILKCSKFILNSGKLPYHCWQNNIQASVSCAPNSLNTHHFCLFGNVKHLFVQNIKDLLLCIFTNSFSSDIETETWSFPAPTLFFPDDLPERALLNP